MSYASTFLSLGLASCLLASTVVAQETPPRAAAAASTPSMAVAAAPVAAVAASRPHVGFSIIKTGKVAVMERLLLPDGSLGKTIDTNFSAFLVKHDDDYLLFDTGLGKQIDAQYAQDMPYWQRPFFKFDRPVQPARAQLDAAGYAPVQQVIISHSHWDHAGGAVDFPQARLFASEDEMATIAQPHAGAGGTWPSQVAAPPVHWEPLGLQAVPYKGYAQSLDWFHDGSVVLVAMPGHTAGSIGMFVTVDSGTCYFFIGDVAWKAAAVQLGAPKFWAASWIVDRDRAQTRASVEKVRDVLLSNPGMVLVPAHDAAVQDALGYFPNWVR